MKKIINGKAYNTDTAEKLGDCWNGESDLRYCLKTLYRERTGEYFLHCVGGGMTIYNGQRIKPLTEAEARKWAEEYLTADEYEQIFGLVEE